jgi:hypothetical protein|eukprot:COSAG01_NODE_2255_length_8070_cov_25.147786_12_plen_72_part_00
MTALKMSNVLGIQAYNSCVSHHCVSNNYAADARVAAQKHSEEAPGDGQHARPVCDTLVMVCHRPLARAVPS